MHKLNQERSLIHDKKNIAIMHNAAASPSSKVKIVTPPQSYSRRLSQQVSRCYNYFRQRASRMEESPDGSYKEGEVIMTCDPFAKAVHFSSKGFHCDHCLAPLNKPIKCLRCRKMFYCNADCKKADWKAVHRQECPLYARDMTNRLKCSSIRLMLRVYFLVQEDPSCLENGGTVVLPARFRSKRSYFDLMSHSANIRKSPADFGLFQQFWDAIKEVNELSPPPPPSPMSHSFNSHIKRSAQHDKGKQLQDDKGNRKSSTPTPDMSAGKSVSEEYPIKETDMLTIYGKIRTNAFVIRDEDARSVGEALYIGASIFDHSCQPNAITTFEGDRLSVLAIRDIASNDEVLISYLDANLYPLELRRDKLQRDFYFICSCERCLMEEMEQEMCSLQMQST